MKLKKIEVTQTVHALVQRFGSVIQANDGSDEGKQQVELSLNSDINSVVIATPKETLLIPREWCVLWPAEAPLVPLRSDGEQPPAVVDRDYFNNDPMSQMLMQQPYPEWGQVRATQEPSQDLQRAFAQTVSDIPAAKVCQWCGASFSTGASLGGHKRHCDKRPT